MEIVAKSQSVKISTRKVRLVADAVRHLSVAQAIAMLSLLDKRGAGPILKTLQSAIANAVNNAKLDEKNLMIASLEVNEGPFLKRFHASTRGRVHPYKKRTSHITIVLKEAKDGTKN
ncbi:MAG: 50S ribosomal protein L22 [Candidatus Levyibacteriota bacterium]